MIDALISLICNGVLWIILIGVGPIFIGFLIYIVIIILQGGGEEDDDDKGGPYIVGRF